MKATSLKVLAIILGATCALTSCGDSGTAPKSASGDGFFQDPVPIGVKYDQPGFGMDYNGKFSGFDIDLAEFIARELKFAPDTFIQIPNDSNRASGLGKNYRMAIATYTISHVRKVGGDGEPPVDFVGPYLQTPAALLVRKNSRYAKKNPDLSGAKVCTLPGSTPADIKLPKDIIPVQGVVNYSDCVKDIQNEDADVMLTDALIEYGYADDSADYPGLAVEPTQYGQTYSYGVAVPHGEVAACQKLISVMENFLDSPNWDTYFTGEFEKVVRREPTKWKQKYKPLRSEVSGQSNCQ